MPAETALGGLERLYVRGARTFVGLLDFELNLLVLGQSLEAVHRDGRVMHKHVLGTVFRGDEPESFLVVEPFYCAFHVLLLFTDRKRLNLEMSLRDTSYLRHLHYIIFWGLGGDDVRRTRTLVTFFNVERDSLILSESFKTFHVDGGVMDEDVLGAVFRRDEAESLLVVKPLYCAFHYFTSETASCSRN